MWVKFTVNCTSKKKKMLTSARSVTSGNRITFKFSKIALSSYIMSSANLKQKCDMKTLFSGDFFLNYFYWLSATDIHTQPFADPTHSKPINTGFINPHEIQYVSGKHTEKQNYSENNPFTLARLHTKKRCDIHSARTISRWAEYRYLNWMTIEDIFIWVWSS